MVKTTTASLSISSSLILNDFESDVPLRWPKNTSQVLVVLAVAGNNWPRVVVNLVVISVVFYLDDYKPMTGEWRYWWLGMYGLTKFK